MLLAYVSQVPQELQGEAASVVALYEGYRARDGTTMDAVVAAATHLVDQFPAANRRSGARENPSLGHLPGRQDSTLAQPVSDETGQRIARALEALVALLAGVHGAPNPLNGDSDSDSS